MIYPNELVRYKNTNFEHPKGLQIFSAFLSQSRRHKRKPNLPKKNPSICKECFHGIQYIWEPGARWSVRIFWCLVLVIAFAGCITMYTMLTQRHHDQVLVTIVDTPRLPIYEIPFPAVALCPFNHINWIRLKAAEEKFLPHNATEEMHKAFYELLVALDNVNLSLLVNLANFVSRISTPTVVQNIVLQDLLQFMAFRCNEVFTACRFDETEMDCCKIFVREHTEKGVCLVFNSLLSEESRIKQLTDVFYPWRVRGAGEESSLSFILRYNASLMRPNSTHLFKFSVMIKEAYEWGETLYHILYPFNHNDIRVTPIMTETSSNARAVSPEQRKCLFSDEKSDKYERIDGLPYNKLNCLAQCQHRYVMKHCNCSMPIFFHKIHVFNYLKAPQQDLYINDTRRGMECDCVDDCLSVVFLVAVNAQGFPSGYINKSVPEIIAHIYYTQNTLTKYEARLEFTNMDLWAYFGGVLGLCLGASMLSFAEIVYAMSLAEVVELTDIQV
uniref:Pickpocket protein 19 n=1 Tax=Stomoxys calcitrans TaxID=35570 RepID=A0A1I8PJ90_STOCA